jgi:hypothetical protein
MTYSHILVGTGESPARPVIRHVAPPDLLNALARGVEDFIAMPSHAIFLCVIYPLIGMLLIGLTLGFSMLPMAFPIVAGYALVGPFAAIGLYELSRRREAGLDHSSLHAFDVVHSPSLSAIVALARADLSLIRDAGEGRGRRSRDHSHPDGVFPDVAKFVRRASADGGMPPLLCRRATVMSPFGRATQRGFTSACS